MDFSEYDKLTEEGFLRKVISPCGDLVLYNYTDKCTYEKYWNEITLNARGTVYEISTGKIIAQAFPKFFNFGELDSEKQNQLLQEQNFEVFEKMDGSLGVVYFYDGKWRVNTRGSFTSDQAIKATEMLSKYNMNKVAKDYTLMCEIIYPENRIIVDYGYEEKLILLAAFDSEWGFADQPTEILTEISENTGIKMAPPYKFKSISDIVKKQSELSMLEEGFVVKFNNNYRVKFKGIEYLKVARIISNMTPLAFWKAMKNGMVCREILEEIPEEFRDSADKIKGFLEASYILIEDEIKEEFVYVIKSIGGLTDLEENRKEVGLWLKSYSKELKHSGAIFPMLLESSEGIDKYIMKIIKPKGNVL